MTKVMTSSENHKENHKLIPLFTVQDVKSNIYAVAPWGSLQMDTDAAGIRHFIGMLKDNYASFRWYNPADYRLYLVGYFDIDSGRIQGYPPELLLDGASLDISDWERGVSTK